jgi:NAD(P)-dependent dehydrogenase (short-subunit alcohol dehydrogenase family)
VRRIVVTGAGSGFGAAIARRLLDRGDAVVGTDVEAGAVIAACGARGALEAHPLELREPGGVAAACGAITAAGPVHGVVCNAGYAVFGAIDDADLDSVAAMLDANLLGQVRVLRGLLPALRATRGSVVLLSSVAGRMAFPESGFYAASKHGLEAIGEALFLENADHGLRVALVEPGAFATGFGARAARSSRPRPSDGPHAAAYRRWDAEKASRLAAPQDPSLVADAVLAALDGGPAFQRVVVGSDAAAILAHRGSLGEDAWVRSYAEALAAR